MSILIIGYYNLADGFLYGAKEFIKKGYNVDFFPFLNWSNNNFDNSQILFEKIQNTKYELVIWWYSNCNTKNIELFNNISENYNITIKKTIIYNWDPILYHCKDIVFWKNKIQSDNNIFEKKLCNEYHCVTPDQIIDTKNFNCEHNLPGFSKELVIEKVTNNDFDGSWNSFNKNHSYMCDISFILTNLYCDENFSPTQFQLGNRKKIIDYFYEKRDKYIIHIYGPEQIGNLYPEIYKGYVKYEDCVNIFNKSKVNINYNISSFLNKQNMDYYSERLPQILGSGGLLISDCNYNSIENGVHHIKITNDKFENLENIINNINDYQHIRENGWKKAWESMSWEVWASKILKNN